MAITLDGTTGISSVDGSNASPSLRGTDANSGIVYAADEVKLSTGGSERLRIASAGQLGIAGANYGTDGQVLTSTGAGSAPAWESASSSSGAAFRASLTSNVSATNTIVFNSQQYEQGGDNYDPTTGIFTCPTAGLYIFVAACTSTNHSGGRKIVMYKGTDAIGRVYAGNNFKSSSLIKIAPLLGQGLITLEGIKMSHLVNDQHDEYVFEYVWEKLSEKLGRDPTPEEQESEVNKEIESIGRN